MAAIARTDSVEQRAAILARLAGRNRLVGILRLGVPALGVVVFAALALQIYVGNLLQQYGVSGIRIDRNNLIVETPGYTAAGEDGTIYQFSAGTARAALDNPNTLALSAFSLTAVREGTPTYYAKSSEATLDTVAQHLTVPGATAISSEDGMTGTVMGLKADLANKTLRSDSTVTLTFPDGATLDAAGMSFDSVGRTWTFTGVKLVLEHLPGVEQ
jgi:lipopolysaccharide export system protein LptC